MTSQFKFDRYRSTTVSAILRLVLTVLAITLTSFYPAAQAALFDRGGGLLYDDILDITWLQDANYAKTSGYDSDGSMSWDAANTWVSNLVYHDTERNVDYTGWRLPSVKPIGTEFNYQWNFDGTTDEGYNITSPNSELSYMYYVNLGLTGWYFPSGAHPTSFGVLGGSTAIWSGQADIGLVKNLQSSAYWSNTADTPYQDNQAWIFTTAEGNQRDGFPHPNSLFAWAVHPGDIAFVATIPEPKEYILLLTGLSLLMIAVWRKKKTAAI